MPVEIHDQKRKKCAIAGWKSTPRCAWLRCRYSVTGKNRQLRDDQEIHAFCQPRGMTEAVIEEIENIVEHDVGIPQEGRANFGLYGSNLRPASDPARSS
jgi:hypothetical protein